jgi:hypothetical protein
VASKRRGGEGSGRGIGLRLLFSLESKQETTSREFCQDLLGLREGGSAGLLPPLGQFVKKKRKQRKVLEARVVMADFSNSNFEFFKLSLKLTL